MNYKFYVQMDGEGYGPYSVQELMGLGVTDDTLLTEEGMNGQWVPAREFDFEEMLRKEQDVSRITSASQSSYNNAQTMDPPVQSSAYGYSHTTKPSIIGKWNWGAFALSWLWGIFNGLYWPLLLILINFIPYLGWIAYIGGSVYLGLKGNELSWNRKQGWSSVEYFEDTQQKWSKAGLIVLGVAVVFGILMGIEGLM